MDLMYSDDRINYIAGQIAAMFSGKVEPERLGKLALELMVVRETVEEVVKGKISPEEKKKARKTLQQLKEIEKNIVRLYLFRRFGSSQLKKSPFLEYMVKRYEV